MIIYLITNIINNKKYVGQTKHKLETRWSQHKHAAGRKIINTSTGQIFNSIKQAANYYKVSPASIGRFLREGWGKCHNLKLSYLEA